MLKHEDPVLLVSVTRWNALWQGAASSVALWDHMSTLDQEIELIWVNAVSSDNSAANAEGCPFKLRKWSFTSFLYFITRYVADISFIHAIVSAWSYGRFLDNMYDVTPAL
ncbi:hypothetical protein BKA70DRAFT_1431477 [Coprinopsis sp. MPI-PUGE-AT-0042]|nr:hypothetical protein BKA70DRAFT_1431477 [Coprinopsis sp. MPI-PUGE-AT-0042]